MSSKTGLYPETVLYAGLLFAVWSTVISPYYVWAAFALGLAGWLLFTMPPLSRNPVQSADIRESVRCPMCGGLLYAGTESENEGENRKKGR